MTENNQKNNDMKPSNDISEMLRLLRESVENEKRSPDYTVNEEDAELSAANDEIKASLEKVFEEKSLDNDKIEDDEDDFFEADEEDASWFRLIEDDEADVEEELEYLSEDEENVEDKEVFAAETEIFEEKPAEEDPDSDAPWYDEEGSENEVEIDEEKPAEEDPDGDAPWYDEEGSENEAETAYEKSAVENNTEISSNGQSVWYAVEHVLEDEAEDCLSDESSEVSLEDQSVWYDAEEGSEEEFYQDELESDLDDPEYEADLSEDDEDAFDIASNNPENDYNEENVYIYDAEKEAVEEDLYGMMPKEESVMQEDESQTDDIDIEEESVSSEDEKNVDETDITFLSTLGVVTSDDEESTEPSAPDGYAGHISYDYDGGEYVLENQKQEISSGYRNEKKITLIRLIIAGAITALLLLYDVLSFNKIELPSIFNLRVYPVSHIMISLQLLILCALFSIKQLYVGIVDLFSKKATPYSVSAVLVTMNIIYSVAISIISFEGFALYNFVAAASVVVSIAYEYLLIITEEHTFDVVSSKRGQKYAFVYDNMSKEMTGDGNISLRASTTEFNKNYFFRMRKRSEDYSYLTVLIVAVLSASVVMLLASLIFGQDSYSLRNAVLLIDVAMPMGVLGAFCYPVFRASVKALGKRGAMLGHSAVDEYSKTRFVTFDEEELFVSLKTTHLDLKPASNNNISEVLCKTSMLLSAIGGPMKRMVEVMQGDFRSAEVKIDEIFDDGISAIADGSIMLAGSAQFLVQHGVAVDCTDDDFSDADASNEVLYVSIDGKLAARYYLKYKADMEFIKLVNELGARGISVGIRTRNPGINSDIIARRCPEMKYKVYTIKSQMQTDVESQQGKKTTDSGIVAVEKTASLAYPLLACCDLKKYYKIDKVVRIASAAIGALVVAVHVILGAQQLLSPFVVLIYQAFWFLPTVLFGIIHFRHRSKRKKIKILHRR